MLTWNGGVPGSRTLTDHDDWKNLTLPFQSGAAWVLGGALLRSRAVAPPNVAPFADHTREVSDEVAPSASFFESLRARGAAR
jgi:hypothetical protein